ncbi:hypothetical protein [Pseudomonas aeruginosa]
MPVFAEFSDRAQPFMSTSPRGRQWEQAQRSVNEEIADHARADQAITSDGLKMTTHYDESGRPIRTFQNTTGRKRWLDTWKAPTFLQIRINKRAGMPDSIPDAEYLAHWENIQTMLRTDNFPPLEL